MSVRLVVHDAVQGRWLEFRQPVAVLTAMRLEDVIPVLRELEHHVASGLHAAGFLAYEAAPAFDPALCAFPPGDIPLLWFGLFASPFPCESPVVRTISAPSPAWSATISEQEYRSAVAVIRSHIRQGDTYQVNFTFRLAAARPADPWQLFAGMIRAQGPGYGAFVDTGRWVICSASPELFFSLRGETLVSKPMKGTAPRGLWPADDLRQPDLLRSSAKTRAENLMIVDMVRNDLGRVAAPGTVLPSALFVAERYPTLWQLTSTVGCRTESPVTEILRALFPAASITGAPKVRTTEIIRRLETTPRGIYTGTIGFLSPGRTAQFSVAIRTVLIDTERGMAEYGTGSGIVWDSDDRSEYAECLLKAEIVERAQPEFSLLETLLWTPEQGYFLLDLHLDRLVGSAGYFSYSCDRSRIERTLHDLAGSLPAHPHRVRLLLSPQGEPRAEASAFDHRSRYRVCLARKPVDPRSVFLYHKTTERELYSRALAEAPGFDDVLLWNEHGEITESTRANVVVELNGRLLTPPVSSGLLPGVYRSHLLERGTIRESTIQKEDLPACSRVFLINALRKMWEIRPEERA